MGGELDLTVTTTGVAADITMILRRAHPRVISGWDHVKWVDGLMSLSWDRAACVDWRLIMAEVGAQSDSVGFADECVVAGSEGPLPSVVSQALE